MADTHIKYNDHSVGSAFKDHYIVPDYQREYVWQGEQVEQLLADILDAYNEDNKKAYFLGTIVTFDTGSHFELIDGQQRLTTFFILLCALKKIYRQNGEDTSVLNNLVYSSTMDENGDTVNQYHLQLQYEDARNYLEMIEKDETEPQNMTSSGERLFRAYRLVGSFLVEKFQNIADLKKFVVFLLNKTSFVRIETYDVTDALKIFETINQRGKGLDPMDLLKNMIFRQVSRDKFKELNMNWKEITRTLESIDEKPLRFLRYFIMANYDTSDEKDGILREDRIYEWLSKHNDQCHYVEQPFKFVNKMSDAVRTYKRCRRPDGTAAGDVHLKNIPLLAGQSYKLHLMLMLAGSEMEEAAAEKFKAVMESVTYYTVIDRISTNITERIFASWCKPVRGIKTVDELNDFVRAFVIPTVNNWKTDNESNFLRLSLNSMQQYRIKFILGKITAFVDSLRMGKTQIESIGTYTQSSVEIEHIMPQTCKDKSAYGVSEEEFPIYLNRLGNLTLLENSINKPIHNNAYPVKAEAYKQSMFYLTSALAGLVDQGQDTAINRTNSLLSAWTKWNKEAIEERQMMLYRLSEQIWEITI